MTYPKCTIILRGCTNEDALRVVQNLSGFEKYFAVEVTLNTEGALEIISRLTKEYGDSIQIGAGTVRNITDATAAIKAGAQFLLGPHIFEPEIFELAKEKKIVTVPGAFSPSEIIHQFQLGADIVKVFPASSVGADFFKDVQAPLGRLKLMAVGGVNQNNLKEYFDKGASFVGIGSGIFGGKKISDLSDIDIRKSYEYYREIIEEQER